MNNHGEGIHRFPGDEHVHFNELGGLVAGVFIIHGAVAARHGFELVVEIHQNFRQRDGAGEHYAHVVNGLRIVHAAAFFQDKLHDIPDVFPRKHNEHLDDRFPDFLNFLRFREQAGIVHIDFLSIGLGDLINHGGVGGDDIHVEFPAQTLLDDFHMEQAKEAATEPEAQSYGRFRLEGESGVINLKLRHGRFQGFKIGGIHRINAGKDHGADFLETGQGGWAGAHVIRIRVPDFDIRRGFHVGDDVAYVAGFQGIRSGHFGGEDTHFLHFIHFVRCEKFDFHAAVHAAGNDAHIGDYAAVGVVNGIEHQGAQKAVLFRFRRRDALNNGFQNIVNADAHLGGGMDGFLMGDADDVLQLAVYFGQVGTGKVNLIDDGDNGQVQIHGQVHVGKCLGFHSLGRVHNKKGSLACRQGTGHFIGEIHMARRIQKIELVSLSVPGLVENGNGVGLDGDALFPLQIHGVQKLILLLPFGNGIRLFQQPVGKGGLSVVDVSDNGEIASQFNGHGGLYPSNMSALCAGRVT